MLGKVVELPGGGSDINRAYPVLFCILEGIKEALN